MMMKSKNPSVYAVVLNWNGYFDTKNCLISLQSVDYDNLHIIIVDNASTDHSYDQIIQEFPNLKTIRADFNGGYAYGINIGVREALKYNSNYILVLNNDTAFERDFLSKMINLGELKEEIGIISPKVAYMESPDLIYCGGGEYSSLKCVGIAKYQGKEFDKYATKTREISFAEGCCMLVKAKVFENVGLMSEDFFMYFEEVEFSLRVREKFKIFFEPSSKIYHKAGAGKNWKNFTNLYYYYFTRNRFLLYKNHSVIKKFQVFSYSTIIVVIKIMTLGAYFLISKQEKRIHFIKAIKTLVNGYFDGIKVIIGKKITGIKSL